MSLWNNDYDYGSIKTSELPALTAEHIKVATDLLTKGMESKELERWPLPFPMGVFGTLRQGRGNNYLMHRGKAVGYSKAFMPHFIATGLSIQYAKNSSAPFEIFFYEPEEWSKMIPQVDRLESFSPPRTANETHRSYGYYRTLAWLRVLPADYKHELFEETRGLSSSRNLGIKPEDWNNYQRLPCWVYSSTHQNSAASENPESPVIWGTSK